MVRVRVEVVRVRVSETTDSSWRQSRCHVSKMLVSRTPPAATTGIDWGGGGEGYIKVKGGG